MKAIVHEAYGPPEVLMLREVPKPNPRANEILVRICASSVCRADVRLRGSDFPPLLWLPVRLVFGLFRPKRKILGHEFSGVVVGRGKEVTRFELGDWVYGTTTLLKAGSHAEFLSVPESWKHGVIGPMPKNLDFEQAAVVPIGSLAAYFLLARAKTEKGKRVLVYGASGSVGSYAVQIAKAMGAEVTAVCSGGNFSMVESLGADRLIDYTKEDYSAQKHRYDIVFDAVGFTRRAKAKRILVKKGIFLTVKQLTKEDSDHFSRIGQLLEEGKLVPFIDRTFTMAQIREAHRYVKKGHKRGNVVLKVADGTCRDELHSK